MNVEKVNPYDKRFWYILTITLFISIVLPIIAFYTWIPSLGIFFFSFSYIWIIPAKLGFFPLFSHRLVYSRIKMIYFYYLFMIILPFIGVSIIAIDLMNYDISSQIINIIIYTIIRLKNIFLILLGTLGITFLIKGGDYITSIFRKKYDIPVDDMFRYRVPVMGYSEPIHINPNIIYQGFPITIINNSQNVLVTSFVFFISYGEARKEVAVPLDKIYKIQPKDKEIILIDWGRVSNAALNIYQEVFSNNKEVIFKIGFRDENTSKIYEGQEINPFRIISQKRYMEFQDELNNKKRVK